MAKFCSISKDTIFQNQFNMDNDDFISIHLIPEEEVQSNVIATKELLKNSAIVKIISFINYLRIVTRANYFISGLNTHFVIELWNGDTEGKWTRFHTNPNSTLFTEVACDNANPIVPSGFYMSKMSTCLSTIDR